MTIKSGNPLIVETDASGVTIAGKLSQNGQPVDSLSRTLSATEKLHSTVERGAQAIIESLNALRANTDCIVGCIVTYLQEKFTEYFFLPYHVSMDESTVSFKEKIHFK